MKVLILGGQGMLGHKLLQTFQTRFDTYATFHNASVRLPIMQDKMRMIVGVDARKIDTVINAFAQVRPDVVVNSIGIIKQLETARDPALSLEVNALFPHRLAELCRATSTRMIQISTDCVFSGERGFYSEEDIPDPVDLYGRTKLLGEVNEPHCLTIRTSIIGRDFMKNAGLLEWFINNRGKRVKGFAHAVFSGFTTQALSQILSDVIVDHSQLSGIYHVAAPPINKYTLLQRIRDAMDIDIDIDRETTVRINRSLNPARFIGATGIQLPDWDSMIVDLVADPTPYDQWRKK